MTGAATPAYSLDAPPTVRELLQNPSRVIDGLYHSNPNQSVSGASKLTTRGGSRSQPASGTTPTVAGNASFPRKTPGNNDSNILKATDGDSDYLDLKGTDGDNGYIDLAGADMESDYIDSGGADGDSSEDGDSEKTSSARKIKSKVNKHTERKIQVGGIRFKTFLLGKNETRDFKNIPKSSMDQFIGNFIMNYRNLKTGEDVEPDTLSAAFRTLNHYLKRNGCDYDIYDDEEFSGCHQVLTSRRKELTGRGKGNRPNRAKPLTKNHENALFASGEMGMEGPRPLINMMWYGYVKCVGFSQAGDEARQLTWGDIRLHEGTQHGDYLEWNDRLIKSKNDLDANYVTKVFADTENPSRCFVQAYKLYRAKRPVEALHLSSPFFLMIRRYINPSSHRWYKNNPLGINTLNSLMATMAKNLGWQGKYTNNSAKITYLNQMVDDDVDPVSVTQVSEQHSEDMNHPLSSTSTQTPICGSGEQVKSEQGLGLTAASKFDRKSSDGDCMSVDPRDTCHGNSDSIDPKVTAQVDESSDSISLRGAGGDNDTMDARGTDGDNSEYDDSDSEPTVGSRRNRNTERKIRQGGARFRRFLHEKNERRKLKDIPKSVIDCMIGNYIIDYKNLKSGDDVEPATLSGAFCALNNVLRRHGCDYDIFKDKDFTACRKVLKTRKKELTKMGRGKKPNRSKRLTKKHEHALFSSGEMGMHTPVALTNMMWYGYVKCLDVLQHVQGHDANRQLMWGDLQLREGGDEGDYLQWDERLLKDGKDSDTHGDSFVGTLFANTQDPTRCFVQAYKLYKSKRADDMLEPDSPFFLHIVSNIHADSPVWYKNKPLGKNTLNSIMGKMATNLGWKGKFTTHSARPSLRKKGIGCGVAQASLNQPTISQPIFQPPVALTGDQAAESVDPRGTDGDTSENDDSDGEKTPNSRKLKSKNTERKINEGGSRFTTFLFGKNETRDFKDIPKSTMDQLIGSYIMDFRNLKTGEDVEPETLSVAFRILNTYLQRNGCDYDIMDDDDFSLSRDVLEGRRKELFEKGKGRRQNRPQHLTEDHENALFSSGEMGMEGPRPLINMMWYCYVKCLGFSRACERPSHLTWGDLQLHEGGEQGQYIEWNDRLIKSKSEVSTNFVTKVFADTDNPSRCFLQAYRLYRSKRPSEMLHPDCPFFLQVRPKVDSDTPVWYKSQSHGINHLTNLMNKMAKNLGWEGKFTAKSCCNIKTLDDSGCAPGMLLAQVSDENSGQGVVQQADEEMSTVWGTNVGLSTHTPGLHNYLSVSHPFLCQECGSCHQTLGKLNIHLRAKHKVDVRKDADTLSFSQPFLCQDCGSCHQTLSKLNIHRRAKHRESTLPQLSTTTSEDLFTPVSSATNASSADSATHMATQLLHAQSDDQFRLTHPDPHMMEYSHAQGETLIELPDNSAGPDPGIWAGLVMP